MTIIYWILCAQTILAFEIAVPRPAEMLSQSDIVVVATLSTDQGNWFLMIQESVKGEVKVGEKLTLESPYNKDAFSFSHLVKLVGGEKFLFVGKLKPRTRIVEPTFGICSAWPQGTTNELLPERTLEGVVAYARKHLASATKPSEFSQTYPQPIELGHADEIRKPPLQAVVKKPKTPRANEEPIHAIEHVTVMYKITLFICMIAILLLLWKLLRPSPKK